MLRSMTKRFISLLSCLLFTSIFAQEIQTTNIQGVIKHLDRDSLVFRNELMIPKEYYWPLPVMVMAQNDRFKMTFPKSAYPQMYTLSIPSEINTTGIFQRGSDFFIDAKTKSISIDLNNDSEEIDGKTYREYKEQFLPFFPTTGDQSFLSKVIADYNKNKQLYPKLRTYTKLHPDSYVSLWALIFAISRNAGTFQQQREVLDAFSSQMKQGKLWKLVDENLNKVTVRLGDTFPSFDLQDEDLKPVKLILPTQKYVLVDWWFSTCKPCLEAYEKLKPIYANYKNKGFEIIAISTDQTPRVPIWQKRIKDKGYLWPQYLDENAKIATVNNILSFPHNYLLENGKIIKENLSPEEVEEFLKLNLN